MYIAGEACGALTQTFIGDYLGRIRFMQLMCIIVTIGCVIQTASQNMGMFLAGRVLAGYAVGCVVPLFTSNYFSTTNRCVAVWLQLSRSTSARFLPHSIAA